MIKKEFISIFSPLGPTSIEIAESAINRHLRASEGIRRIWKLNQDLTKNSKKFASSDPLKYTVLEYDALERDKECVDLCTLIGLTTGKTIERIIKASTVIPTPTMCTTALEILCTTFPDTRLAHIFKSEAEKFMFNVDLKDIKLKDIKDVNLQTRL